MRLNELWRRWLGQTPRQLRRHRRAARARLTFEAPEDRTCLSVSIPGELISAINDANSSSVATNITLDA